ncbi:MAG: MotA/TolQ/ExbB proton channel family protein [bacterium]
MLQLIYDGGWFMVPLGVCSVLAVGFAIERVLYLWRQRTDVESFWSEAEEPLKAGNWNELRQICKEYSGLVPEVILVAAETDPRSEENVQSELQDFSIVVNNDLQQFLPALDFIARVSPLLGLLGTVAGMIRTFSAIAQVGPGNPELLAGGISQALVTTATGLTVGITALLFHHLLSRSVDNILHELEVGSRRILTAIREMQ